MKILVIFTLIVSVISFIFDREKTIKGIKKGMKQFFNLLPTLLSILAIISVILYFVSNEFIVEHLGDDAGFFAYISAAVIGSITILPGFISYPLAAISLKTGVSFSVIAVFITTLKMVGFMTIPIEAKYFGLKTALIRNLLSFIGALLVGGIMAVIYYKI